MKSSTSQLPSRFPVGTRYVVEGSRGSQGGLRVRSRYLEFPDGKHLDLLVRNPDRRRSGHRRGGVLRENNLWRRGTDSGLTG
jgi:hypothetical protein